MKNVGIVLFILGLAFVSSCNSTSNKPANGKAANAEVKKGVTPVADPEIAVIEM